MNNFMGLVSVAGNAAGLVRRECEMLIVWTLGFNSTVFSLSRRVGFLAQCSGNAYRQSSSSFTEKLTWH